MPFELLGERWSEMNAVQRKKTDNGGTLNQRSTNFYESLESSDHYTYSLMDSLAQPSYEIGRQELHPGSPKQRRQRVMLIISETQA